MKKITFILVILLYSCSHTINNPKVLYKEFMNINPKNNLTNIKGEGKIAIPNFMSWGILNYNCNSAYIDSLIKFDNFFEENEFNKKFERDDTQYFPKDLSYWTEHSKGKYKVDFQKQNCVYLRGINFPFIHDILIDSTSFEVLHLISAMRD